MQRKETKLLNAAKSNKFDDVRKIFEKIDKAKLKRKSKGAIDIDVNDSNGCTPLHHASKHGNIEMMIFLVSRGADIESVDKIGWRPISYACASNSLEAVKALIQWKSSVNKYSVMEENSPMHIAAGLGFVNIVKLLMESGANVHSQNKKNQTPMDVACENNHYGVVNALLSASSKLIDDNNSKSLTINNLEPLISSSLSRSSLFIKSVSVNNSNHLISRLKSGISINGDYELKRRTIGSQSQLCTPMELPTPKKSGSLNTVFMKDQMFDELDNRPSDDLQKEKRESKFSHSGIEVNLPYPSKFSTSEKLKIKSPLLASKNWKLRERGRHISPSAIDNIESQQCSAQLFYPPDTPKSSNDEIVPQSRMNRRPLTPTKPSKCNINSPVKTASFLSPNSAPPEIDSTSSTHNKTFHSIRRAFESETDIPISPVRRENSQMKSAIILKPAIRSPFIQDNISAKSLKVYMKQNNPFENNEKFTCRQWIKSIKLERIWDTLIKEGFDNFLSLSLATDDELLQLCDNNIEFLDILKSHLESLKIPPIHQLSFSMKISDILLQLGLECYTEIFLANHFTDTQQLAGFDEMDLDKLQIFKTGHRKLLLNCLGMERQIENGIIENPCSSTMLVESPVTNMSDSVHLTNSGCESPMPIGIERHKSENYLYHCNNLSNKDSQNHSNVIIRKKPPPVPSRSSSIIDSDRGKSLVLDDILSDAIVTKKKDENNNITSKHTERKSSLDDIVDLLANLGKELEQELDNI